MKIAYFGHDAGDAMINRRLTGLDALGHEVTALTMRRGPDTPRPFTNIDLGETRDAALWHRLAALPGPAFRSDVRKAAQDAELVWARNLDMLLIASAVTPRGTPLIYECLDIHDRLLGRGPDAVMLRETERQALKKVRLILTSSPAFERQYFTPYQASHPPVIVVENRVPQDRMPPRPAAPVTPPGPLRLGWVGILRCRRSLDLLAQMAWRFEGAVGVHLHGRPATAAVPDFDTVVKKTPHLTYHGSYTSPDDLSAIYHQLDLIWAGDWYQSGGNSQWLLPNRLYEAGYFGVPAIAPQGTETARWIEEYQTGLTLTDPVEDSLARTLQPLLDTPKLLSLKQKVLYAPADLFAAPADELAEVITKAVSR